MFRVAMLLCWSTVANFVGGPPKSSRDGQGLMGSLEEAPRERGACRRKQLNPSRCSLIDNNYSSMVILWVANVLFGDAQRGLLMW